jgi:hypothetical protein
VILAELNTNPKKLSVEPVEKEIDVVDKLAVNEVDAPPIKDILGERVIGNSTSGSLTVIDCIEPYCATELAKVVKPLIETIGLDV